MLERLVIENFVILQKQEIRFGPGLNVITGETGSGKSIMLGALRLALGRRAESGVLFDNARKAVIEAFFTGFNTEVNAVLEAADIDTYSELIMRREINPNGKSRAFVNDTPVKLAFMQELSVKLIDMHEQFESLEIQQSEAQYALLDGYAGNQQIFAEYTAKYREMRKLLREIATLKEKVARAQLEKDFTEFQLTELNRVLERDGTLEEWESEYEIQEHAEGIQSTLFGGAQLLGSEDNPVTDELKSLHRSIEQYAGSDRRLSEVASRLDSLIIELEDLGGELESLAGEIEPDPARKSELEPMIDEARKLLLKHRLTTSGDLVNLASELTKKLEDIDTTAHNVEQLEEALQNLLTELNVLADKLSSVRAKEGHALSEKVTAMLRDLEMKNARFRVSLETREQIDEHGKDTVDFIFASNKGAQGAPIGKIASGGELSRLSLCLKSAVARKIDLPTLVFDEIDTGVSGQVAVKMGQMLRDLASDQQIIMITHSPQIAGCGQHHLKVYKVDTGGRSEAHVEQLQDGERVGEIAKMLSGDPPTEAAMTNARELIIQ